MEYVTIHPNDTVKVCLQDGHKYARRAIRKGQPVIKYGFPIGIATADIATNTALAKKKPGWIDLDAQTATTDDLFNLILRTANGQETQNERHGYREIAIFKDGVTL